MNDSCENVFCRRAGERSGPVKKGDSMTCESTRSLRTVPVPPVVSPTVPVVCDGTVLLLSYSMGRGAGERG